jgi:hypothetical protein
MLEIIYRTIVLIYTIIIEFILLYFIIIDFTLKRILNYPFKVCHIIYVRAYNIIFGIPEIYEKVNEKILRTTTINCENLQTFDGICAQLLMQNLIKNVFLFKSLEFCNSVIIVPISYYGNIQFLKYDIIYGSKKDLFHRRLNCGMLFILTGKSSR